MKTFISFLFFAAICISGYSQDTGSFVDVRDNKVYKTIKIGTQIWMAENLAYKPESGFYLWDKSDSGYIEKYGYMYDLLTALEIAPSGWHLPTKDEWKVLYDYLGGSRKKAYLNIIEGGTSGFNAAMSGMPGILFGQVNGVTSIGDCTGYWCSTRFGFGAYAVSISASTKFNAGFVSIGIANMPCYNVRLIKD